MWFWCWKYTKLHQWSGYGFNAQNHLTGMSNCLLAIKALEILIGTHEAKQNKYVMEYIYTYGGIYIRRLVCTVHILWKIKWYTNW